MSQFKGHQARINLLLGGGSGFLFYSGLQLLGYVSHTLGKAICFTQSTDINVSLIQKHPQRNTQNDG